MFRFCVQVILALLVAETYTVSLCYAQEMGERTRVQGYGDLDYERAERKFREHKRKQERHRQEDQERHERIEKADSDARANRFRDDETGGKEEAVNEDDTSFGGKRKMLDDDFDASKFKSPSFAGTNFEKNSFDDMDQAMRKIEDRDTPAALYLVDETDMPRRELEEHKVQEEKLQERLSHREHEMAGDWLPSPLDPIVNGGFAIEEDNGAPVPYKLNGHVDLQRKPAWLSADN